MDSHRRSSAFWPRAPASHSSSSHGRARMSRNGLFDLTGKTAAVIGGGSGIGEAVALGAAAHGATVVVLDANADAGQRVASAIGAAASGAVLDIRDGGAVRTALEQIARE